MGKGTIVVELEGMSPKELARCKEIIDNLFIRRVFSIRNGSAELHFDSDGSLKSISYHTQWRKDKPEEIADEIKAPKVSLQ